MRTIDMGWVIQNQIRTFERAKGKINRPEGRCLCENCKSAETDRYRQHAGVYESILQHLTAVEAKLKSIDPVGFPLPRDLYITEEEE